MTPFVRPVDHRSRRFAMLLAVASILALGAFAPAAQAEGTDNDCDFQVVRKTGDLSYKCEGNIVEQPVGPEPPGGNDDEPGTRSCGTTAGTAVVRAINTSCAVARLLVSMRDGREKYAVGSFDCKDRRGLITCRRNSTDETYEGRVTFRLDRDRLDRR